MKLIITTHWGTGFLFFKTSSNNVTRQKIKLRKIASCPNITRVPVTNGSGKILSSFLFCRRDNSI
ncbi:MAG: hypothetical protein WKI04_02875 [Ferruginibacter sp.]